jgi:bifunctional DNA-binding transcriptional regulator/antitoxin component of YhaV-PrlF toxin-antitoxin module
MSVSLSVDEVGRLVLPKPVREALGIRGRARLKLEIVGEMAQLSREGNAAGPLRRRGGRLVFAGELPSDWDSGEAVQKMRAQRLKR